MCLISITVLLFKMQLNSSARKKHCILSSDIYRNNFVNKQAKLLLFRTIERFQMKMRERKIIKLYKSLFIHNMLLLYKTASE